MSSNSTENYEFTLRLKNYIENEIRMRYAPKSILPFHDNEILHSLVKADATFNISREDVKNLSFMNENIIQLSQTLLSYLPINMSGNPRYFDDPFAKQLLEELDLVPTKEDFQRIGEKNIRLCLVGYGGAMINMLHNMFLWSMELSETRIFEKIVVFEKDSLDFSNIPRIGVPLLAKFKPEAIYDNDPEVPSLKLMPKTCLIDSEKELAKERKIIIFNKWLEENEVPVLNKKGYIFVGAPTLDTRNMLFKKEANFFFFGHGDYEVEITYKPVVESGLAAETYGSIDIPALLINLHIATAAFIKQLAYNETPEEPGVQFKFDIQEYLNRKDDNASV